MQKILTVESQGNRLHIYHHGYVVIETTEPHFGFQVYPEIRDQIIQALLDTVPDDEEDDAITG